MKKIIYSSLLVLSSGIVYGQSIDRQVFNSFGKVTQNGGITLATNVGEPLTRAYYAGNEILTQGFLQPFEKDMTMSFSEPGGNQASVHIWPNPTAEGLFISYENLASAKGSIMIYDMAGKCLLIESVCQSCTQQYLSLPLLADGVYVVRLSLGDKLSQDKKFIKVSQ